jgi:hypothetical protein
MLTKIAGPAQVLAAGAAASTSTAFTGYSRVRIASTVSIFIAIGTSPTATATTGTMVVANCPEVFYINKGFNYTDVSTTVTNYVVNPADKVSVLAVTTAGAVSITPVAS